MKYSEDLYTAFIIINAKRTTTCSIVLMHKLPAHMSHDTLHNAKTQTATFYLIAGIYVIQTLKSLIE